jgi:hypothetical protein
MASAILTLLDPRRYGVIDIRVWQLLYRLGTVTQNPNGVGFTFDNWYRFLMVVRHFSRMLKVHARDIERTLFAVHQKYQKGRLYLRASDPPAGFAHVVDASSPARRGFTNRAWRCHQR